MGSTPRIGTLAGELVPIFGMSASAIVLSEPMPAWKLLAAGLVLAGLALNLMWPLIQARLRAR